MSITDSYPVDVVITWVDGNDPSWLAEKNRYLPEADRVYRSASDANRFQDWGTLPYLFRGIESFMPWVNRVFFVTWGHLPPWLNTEYEKLRIVRHEDYIPEKYRPTFNSNAIELNFHRIPDLSEHFVYFNDDCFVIGPTQKKDFFRDEMPRTEPILRPVFCGGNGIGCTEARNTETINKHFSPRDIRAYKKKWVYLYNPRTALWNYIYMRKYFWIIGFQEPHIPISFLKSTFTELWEKEYAVMDETCSNRFRGKCDANLWLAREWQMLQGKFFPRKRSFGKYSSIPNGWAGCCRRLRDPGESRLLCINDNNYGGMHSPELDAIWGKIRDAFEDLLPVKSEFEI